MLGGILTWRTVLRLQHERSNQSTWAPRTLHWLTKEGSLTALQAERIRPTVATAMEALAGLRDRAAVERKEILGRMLTGITGQLDPEQCQRITQAVSNLLAR